jgi:hypothetical protein
MTAIIATTLVVLAVLAVLFVSVKLSADDCQAPEYEYLVETTRLGSDELNEYGRRGWRLMDKQYIGHEMYHCVFIRIVSPLYEEETKD